MLKRNGENCEHTVPDFPGRLTASEFKAYHDAFRAMAAHVAEFNEQAHTLSDIEKRSHQIAEAVGITAAPDLPTVTVSETPESAWQIRQTLFKSRGGEVLLCSRVSDEEKSQFGIVEKFDPQSPYALAHGGANLQITGSDPAVLLQNFVNHERAVLQMFREDIEATTAENLSEKFPGQNYSRVVRAISARCGERSPEKSETESAAQAVRMRV